MPPRPTMTKWMDDGERSVLYADGPRPRLAIVMYDPLPLRLRLMAWLARWLISICKRFDVAVQDVQLGTGPWLVAAVAPDTTGEAMLPVGRAADRDGAKAVVSAHLRSMIP